jgi:hypothetical protein
MKIEIKPYEEGFISVTPGGYLANRFRDFCGIIRSKDGVWKKEEKINVVPMSQFGGLILELQQAGFDPVCLKGTKEELARLSAAEDKKRHILREMLSELQKQNNFKLYPYQEGDVIRKVMEGNILNGNEMGLGKTAEAILAMFLHRMLEAQKRNVPLRDVSLRCVWIVPKSCLGNIQDEYDKFAPRDYGPVKVTILRGRQTDMVWPTANEIVVMNPDILPGKLGVVPDGVILIADEAHAFKNNKAQRTEKFRKMVTQVVNKKGYAWGMTGTPMLHPPDLWNLLFGLRLTNRSFGTFEEFKRCFNAHQGRFGIEWGEPTEMAAVHLRKVMIRHVREDVCDDLPEALHDTVNVLPPDNATEYNKWKRIIEQLSEARNAMVSGMEDKKFEIDSFIKYSMSRGAGFEEYSRLRESVCRLKIPFAIEWVKEKFEETDTPVVVFSCHRLVIDEFGKRDGWRTITGDDSQPARQEAKDLFQAGKLKGVAITKAGGEGINLFYGCHLVFIDKHLNPGVNAQAAKRIDRRGQKSKQVWYWHLIIPGTIDEDVEAGLMEKMATFSAVVDRAATLQENLGTPSQSGLDSIGELAVPFPVPKPPRGPRNEREKAQYDVLVNAQGAWLYRNGFFLNCAKNARAGGKFSRKVWKVFARYRLAETPKEQWTRNALMQLCAADPDSASVINNIGWNKVDGPRGKELHVRAGGLGLTDKEWIAAYRLVTKYRRQVGVYREETTDEFELDIPWSRTHRSKRAERIVLSIPVCKRR